MRKRHLALAVIAAVVGAAAVVALAGRKGEEVPFPDAAAIRDQGFAVWPEDNAKEAAEACEEHSDDQPWRNSARATVIRFGEDHLGYKNAEVIEDQTDVGEETGDVWVTAKGFDLNSIVSVLKAGECWFVTRADYREDGHPTVFFSHRNGFTSVHLENVFFETGTYAEVGFGADSRRIERRTRRLSWRLPADLDSEGHYIFGGGEAVAASRLPPPPTPRAGDVVFPSGGRSIWSGMEPSKKRRACRDQLWAGGRPRRTINELLQWEFAAAMPSGPYPDVLYPGPSGKIGRRVELHQRNERRWLLRVDGVRLEVHLDRVGRRCWPVRSITALNRPTIVNRTWVADDSFTIAMDWGAADRADISLRYGGNSGAKGGGGELHREQGLLIFELHDDFSAPQEFDISEPGYLSVVLYRKNLIVNAMDLRLPPLEDASTP